MKVDETDGTFKDIVCSACESEYEIKVHWTDEDEPTFCPFCGEELEVGSEFE
jgi:hypothetical protein